MKSRSWTLLFSLMQGHWLPYLAAFLAMALGTAVGYVYPLIPAAVLDGLLGSPEEMGQGARVILDALGGEAFLRNNLWLAGVALTGMVAISSLAMYLRGRWSAVASEAVSLKLRNRVYEQLHRTNIRWHDTVDTGDIVQRCTSDVQTVRTFLSQQVVEIGRSLLLFSLAIPFMLMISAWMTLFALILFPLIVAFGIVFFLTVRSVFKKSDEAEGAMTSVLQENLTGVRVVRAFARQSFERDKFAGHNQAYRDGNRKLYLVMATYWSVSDVMCLAQTALVLVLGAYWVRDGYLSVGDLFAMLAYVNMMLWPIRQMGRTLSEMGKATVSLGRLAEVMEAGAEIEPAQSERLSLPASTQGRIEFQHVNFGYDDGQPVLRDVSFTAEPGQTLAFLGPSGSGKSTIMNLLLRLYDPDVGRILIDGIDIGKVNRSEVRQQFAVVMQEPFLYSRSVRENIRFGYQSAMDDQLIDAAHAACIHDSIEHFEKGYDTVVGERGVRLSGGQRQRLAIARALVKPAPVLILDDALSAVDTETEHHILKALRQRHGKRTTLLIAHRLSTLQQADAILVFDHGQIVQRGSHEQLIQQDGPYQRLWKIQTDLEAGLTEELGTLPVRSDATQPEAESGDA